MWRGIAAGAPSVAARPFAPARHGRVSCHATTPPAWTLHRLDARGALRAHAPSLTAAVPRKADAARYNHAGWFYGTGTRSRWLDHTLVGGRSRSPA